MLVVGLISSVMQGEPPRDGQTKPRIKRLILDRNQGTNQESTPSEQEALKKNVVEEDISYFQ